MAAASGICCRGSGHVAYAPRLGRGRHPQTNRHDVIVLKAAIEDRHLIVSGERGRAKAITGRGSSGVGVLHFKLAGCPSTASRLEAGGYARFSALWGLCTDLLQALRSRRGGREVLLVFFGNGHVEEDQMPDGEMVMRSFVRELLRQRKRSGKPLRAVFAK